MSDAPFCGSPDTFSGLPCQREVEYEWQRCPNHNTPQGRALASFSASLNNLRDTLADTLPTMGDAIAGLAEHVREVRRIGKRKRRIRERYIQFDPSEEPPALPEN